ncbi:hypothetical protein ACFVZT_11530, partial [Streptomyces sp. NPDC058321]
NGFFYDLMPPFCIGYEAMGVGDYGTTEGPLSVPTERAEELAPSGGAGDRSSAAAGPGEGRTL